LVKKKGVRFIGMAMAIISFSYRWCTSEGFSAL